METVSKFSFDCLKTKFDALAKKTRLMRENQRLYFKFKSSSYLNNSKKYEAEVDKILKDIYEEQNSTQGNLF